MILVNCKAGPKSTLILILSLGGSIDSGSLRMNGSPTIKLIKDGISVEKTGVGP